MKPQVSKTKLPNFAAIHKKQFEKMENIVEHVARKAERAKVLTSATKSRQGSAHKTQTPGRYGRISTYETEKPKVSRKIELALDKNITMKENMWKTVSQSKIPLIIPRPATTITPPVRTRKAASAEPCGYRRLRNNLKQTSKCDTTSKPLVKSMISKSVSDFSTSAFTFKAVSPVAQTTEKTSTSALNTDKLAARRERNMNVFKSRMNDDKEKKMQNKREEIRGVRLNRRYMLQMEHRRNMEKFQ